MKPSLRELVRRQEELDNLGAKPKFLTREEREKLALERLERGQKGHGVERDTQKMTTGTLSLGEQRMIRERYLSDQNNTTARRSVDRRIKFDWDRSEDTTSSDCLHRPANSNMHSRDPLAQEKHWTEKRLEEMTERDWRIVREDYNIVVQGTGHSTHPLRNWSEARFPRPIHEYIIRKYKEPTPIQRQVIPLAFRSTDTIGLAETGSGKTLAFLLPILSHIDTLRKNNQVLPVALNGPLALIIVPTRELAQQIELAAKPVINTTLSIMVLVGGYRVEEQSFAMRNGADLVIGTPGRLRDFIERHLLVFNQCVHVVLDEADRMIDMNFEEDLVFILEQFGGLMRHTMMFSATMPAACERIARGYLVKPVCTVRVGEIGNVVDSVEQRVLMVESEHQKSQLIIQILNQFSPPMIVFVNQKRAADYLADRLQSFGFRVGGLHGGKAQEQREAVINQLRSGRIDILIATDVAGRGLDVPAVSLVLNYDMPARIEEYVHRVGRTGRAGSTGVAVTFLHVKEDTAVFYDLRQCLQRSPRSAVPVELAQHEASQVKPGTVVQKRRRDETVAAFGV